MGGFGRGCGCGLGGCVGECLCVVCAGGWLQIRGEAAAAAVKSMRDGSQRERERERERGRERERERDTHTQRDTQSDTLRHVLTDLVK